MRHSGAVSEKLRVAVLCGGWSSESKVSKNSGKAVINALLQRGYEVIEIDPVNDLTRFAAQLVSARPDVVFNALHGTGGEDGTIQGALEMAGIPYTHSGIAASAIGIDKRITKLIAKQHGVRVLDDILLKNTDLADGVHPIQPPYVIKPVKEGSSIGVHIVHNDLEAVIPKLTDKEYMVECFIEGQELTVAVLETGNGPEALGITRLEPTVQFYDYKAKYTAGVTEHIVNPTDLPPQVVKELQEWAVLVHCALGCRDVSRSDFRYNPTDGVVFLEINTHPGMTDLSLVPEQAAAKGIDFTTLAVTIIESALRRAQPPQVCAA